MSEEERTRKEKIEQLKAQRKQMEEELDELKGSTGKGKAICVGVFLIAIALLFGIIVALIKTDVGGFASTSLAPVIGDVPIVRSILPKELQRKTAKELLAAQSTQNDTPATQDTQNAGTTDPNAAGTNGVATDPNAVGGTGTIGNVADPNATSGGTTDPNTNGTLGAASNANSSGTAGTTGSAGSTNPAGSTDTQSTEEAAIQDYVQTYTSMRPRNAAQVFDSMLPDQLQLVVKILKNMKPAQRSAILAQMNVQNAPDLLVCNYVYNHLLEGKKKIMGYYNVFPEKRIFTWDEIRHFHPSQYLIMHALIFRTEILRQAHVVLPEHTFYVDNLFAYQPLPYVKTIRYLSVDFYQYFIGRDDQSVNEQVMMKRIDQQIKVTELVAESVDLDEVRKVHPKLANYMRRNISIMLAISSIHLLLIHTDEALEKRKKMWETIRKLNGPLYYRLRFGTLSGFTYLPGPIGAKLTVSGYGLAKKIYQFQ